MSEHVAPTSGHEERDINLRAVIAFGVAVGCIVVVSCLALWILFRQFAVREVERTAAPSTLIQREGPTQPPEPRLQANPPAELRKMLADEDALLDTYGWVDPEHGVVRIPVSRAMELAAQRGLKAVRK